MPVSICYWNVNGSLLNKSIDTSFVRIIERFDIVFLSETHLSTSDNLNPRILSFYTCYRNDRECSKRRSGGVLVLIKSHLSSRVRVYQNVPGLEQLFVCLDNTLIIGGVYIPPRPNSIDIDDRFSILNNTIEEIHSNGLPLLLVGDFNARIGNSAISMSKGPVQHIRSIDKKKNKSGTTLRNIISNQMLHVLSGNILPPAFTSYQASGSATIDLFLCSNDIQDCIVRGSTLNENIYSDHCPVSVNWLSFGYTSLPSFQSDLDIDIRQKFSKRAIKYVQRNSNKLIDLDNDVNRDLTIDRIYGILGWAIDNNICIPKDTLSVLMDDAIRSVKRILYEHVGYKSNTRACCDPERRADPWIDEECRLASRCFRRAQSAVRNHPTRRNYLKLRNAKKSYKSVWKRKRNQHEKEFLDSLFYGNPRDLWNSVQSKRKRPYSGPVSIQTFTSHLTDIANGKFSCSSELLEKCTIRNRKRGERIPSKSIMQGISDHIDGMDIWQLSRNTAPGSDGLTGELINILRSSMCFVFERFMLCFYMAGETPAIWDCDVKVGVLKPGRSGKLASDLRPITLVNVLTKVYERFLLSLLNEHFSTSECQAGFKKGYNCLQRVFSLTTIIRQSLEVVCKPFYCVFIDFSSFFDTVQTEILIDYLYRKDVPPSLCRAIHGMFKNLKARCRLHNITGNSFDVKVGIRQGSVISPFLGTAYLQQISDILSSDPTIASCCDNDKGHIFYADDMVIYSQDIDSLQRTLNVVFNICNKIGLNINVDKTFWTVFSKRAKPRGLKDLFVGDKKVQYNPKRPFQISYVSRIISILVL